MFQTHREVEVDLVNEVGMETDITLTHNRNIVKFRSGRWFKLSKFVFLCHFAASSFKVSLVFELGARKIWGICLGTFVISRPTLVCSHWSEFVHTECHHDVIIS